MFGGFGGVLPLRLGGIDPTLGWSPEQHAAICRDLVAAKRAAPLACWRFTNSGAVVIVSNYLGQNGTGLRFAPSGNRLGVGIVDFVWGNTWLDDYDISEPIAVRAVYGGGNGSSQIVVYGTPSTRGIRVQTTLDGALADVNASVLVL